MMIQVTLVLLSFCFNNVNNNINNNNINNNNNKLIVPVSVVPRYTTQ